MLKISNAQIQSLSVWQMKSCVFHIPVLTISSYVIYSSTRIVHPTKGLY